MLKHINRYYKILWLKSTSIFKEQTRIPLKLTIEKFWRRQKGNKFEQFLQISVHTYQNSTKKATLQWKTSKSIYLLSNRFWNPIAYVSVKVQNEKSSIRNLKHKRKIQSSNWANYTHQYNEVKEKLKPFSFIYVWTKFEHQVKDMYASQKAFSILCKPETQFGHVQSHQRASASTGSENIIQNTIITVNEVESQRSVYTKHWKRTNWYSEVIKEILHHNFR